MQEFIMKILAAILLALVIGTGAQAEMVTKTIEYKDGDVTLEGFLAYDAGISGKRPGVLVVHEWTGLNDYARSRAKQLAESGYVAFSLDMYGKGVRPSNPQEASEQATKYRSDRPLMRRRAKAGLDVLLQQEMTDSTHVAVIGYCFGGGVALELARSGAPLAGVVSFHGNLDTPNPADARNIKGKILVCHGGDDPHVPQEQVLAFQQEMRDAGVDWQMNIYGGAVHAFTNPAAGNDPSRGAAYNAEADHRSWQAMKDFFNEIFK
jgi:dienelactone hydrolase